jgi:hypothetical protein
MRRLKVEPTAWRGLIALVRVRPARAGSGRAA